MHFHQTAICQFKVVGAQNLNVDFFLQKAVDHPSLVSHLIHIRLILLHPFTGFTFADFIRVALTVTNWKSDCSFKRETDPGKQLASCPPGNFHKIRSSCWNSNSLTPTCVSSDFAGTCVTRSPNKQLNSSSVLSNVQWNTKPSRGF